jgi:hypothetical protein
MKIREIRMYPRTFIIFLKPRKFISANLNEFTVIKSLIFVFFSPEDYSTTDSSTQGNRSDGNNGGQLLFKIILNRTQSYGS